MKKIVVILIGSIVLIGCGTQQVIPQQQTSEMMKKYKELTKDVCVDNEHEVFLAQHLYNKMKELKYNR
jgi:uncharacterized protein YcfL